MEAFFSKFSKEQRKELAEYHGVFWEEDLSVSTCRECDVAFSVSERRHHCRGCGGVFCDKCTMLNVVLKGGNPKDPIRACIGCRRGETPGIDIYNIAAKVISARPEGEMRSTPPSMSIPINRNSLYGDDDSRSVRLDGRAAHRMGYFEVVNKSNEVIAIKVLIAGGDTIKEATRPCFIAVPPSETVHCLLNSAQEIEILLLYNNKNRLPLTGGIVYDTRALGVRSTDISPCAEVSSFMDVAIYRVRGCDARNVLLKYKGSDTLELRQGTSLTRISGSILSKFSGSSTSSQSLDFNTNVESVDFVFSSTSSGVV